MKPMNIYNCRENQFFRQKTSLRDLRKVRGQVFPIQFKSNTDDTDCAGAPSKAHTRQLVKIQHEERLASTSELNPTPCLVTDRCEAGGKGYQAAI